MEMSNIEQTVYAKQLFRYSVNKTEKERNIKREYFALLKEYMFSHTRRL